MLPVGTGVVEVVGVSVVVIVCSSVIALGEGTGELAAQARRELRVGRQRGGRQAQDVEGIGHGASSPS